MTFVGGEELVSFSSFGSDALLVLDEGASFSSISLTVVKLSGGKSEFFKY